MKNERKTEFTSYKKELETRLKNVQKEIDPLHEKVYADDVKRNNEWWGSYDKLNELRSKRATIQSRMKNLTRGSKIIGKHLIYQ